MKVTHCDRCGGKNAYELCLVVDRKMDGAGSVDDVCEWVDVCGGCLRNFLYDIWDKLPYDKRQTYLKNFKTTFRVKSKYDN